MTEHQYKDHRAGSSKGKVHEVFDKKGKDAAIARAKQLKIQESTARTWCSSWANAKPAKKAKKAAKAAPAKKAAKKAAAPRKTIKRERVEERASA